MAFGERFNGWKEQLALRWKYRRHGDMPSFDLGEGPAAAPAGRPPRRIERIGLTGLMLILLVIVLYYVGGAALLHTIDDNPDFVPPARDQVQGGSAAVSMMIGLVDREVNDHAWVANDPFFMPGYVLDNMPNYQQGIVSALGRFAFELTDQIGRTRGSSEADPDLQKAAGLLQYPGDKWIWNPSQSLIPGSSSVSQYRQALGLLRTFNQRLGSGQAVYEIRADNLLGTLDRIASDLGSQSAIIDNEVLHSSGGIIDWSADDVFYSSKGKLYAYYMILKGMGQDFAPVIKERNLQKPWDQMLETFKTAAMLQPLVVMNGSPMSVIIPSHLSAQGFFLLRARTQLREVSNILQK
ncbi:MAG: DUF2333 family protein [Parvibaculaceae bacterium]|nr:DUF2333 family protein [Parvibaculaceae bacterium]